MSKCYVCFALLLVVVVGSVKAISPADAGLFIIGFTEGIAVEASGNITQCVIDSEATLDDFDTGFTLVGEGLRQLSEKKVKQGLQYLGNGTQEVGKVLKVCGFESVADEITKIGVQLGQGEILDVVFKLTIDILYHEKTVKLDIEGARTAWQSGDYEVSGKYYGEVIALILTNIPPTQ